MREDAPHEPFSRLLRPHVRQRVRGETVRSPEAVPLASTDVIQKAPLIFARSILIPAGVAIRTFFPTTATSPPQSRTALFSSAVIRLSARSSLARLVWPIRKMVPFDTWGVRAAMSSEREAARTL